jgi:DNA polymerase alpha-associated DNA helicase A
MTRLLKMKGDEYSGFVRVLFGLTSPSPVAEDLNQEVKLAWIDPSLNESQKDAIRFALASREVALIHGPPGVCLPFTNSSIIANMEIRLARRIH